MSTKFTLEQIREAFLKAPDNIKSIMTSPDISASLESVGKKHSIRYDNIQKIIDTTALIVLGLLPISKFVEALEDELETDRETALKIASSIDSLVFEKIRNKVVGKSDQPVDDNNSSIEEVTPPTEEKGVSEDILEKIEKDADDQFDKKLNEVTTSPMKNQINSDPYMESID